MKGRTLTAPADQRRPRGYVVEGQAISVPALAPGLYLVATPIGNLGDVTLRALATLAGADLIACEDTRVSAKLLARYGIKTPLMPYHDHNAETARPKLLGRIAAGASVALISDAGTPLISDPGYKLVRAARTAGALVTVLPGASAALAALTLSGLPTDRFFFEGFLPPKAGHRRARIAELSRIPATLIVFETAPRIASALADLAEGLGPRQVAVCRELTKLHEEVACGDLAALAHEFGAEGRARGEIVIVIAAPPPDHASRASDVETLLREALERLSLKEAVAEIARVTGERRRAVYQRALALAKERQGAG